MQLLLRDGRTLVLHAAPSDSVAALAAAWARRALGVAAAPHAVVLLHAGRQLDPAATLADAGVRDGATLSVTSRLRGGGGDGGSTGAESRSCYLEMYAEKKPDKVNPAEEQLARATRCRLSGERLAQPCVADELGCLYNKEALVHGLLHKTLPPALAHITSLKAVTNLKLDPAPSAGGRAGSHAGAGPGPGSARGADAADFQCPVTGLEMNGRFPFVIHRPSGVVLSERALREVPAAAVEALGGPWSQDELIPVNPTGEELDKRKAAVAATLAAERAKKAAKKAGKAAKAAAAASGDGAPDVAAVGAKRTLPPTAPGAGAVAGAAAAAAAAPQKRLKLPAGATPEVYASIFSTGREPKVKETFLCRSAAGRGRV